MRLVILALMPLGVEHVGVRLICSGRSSVILALMPLGVEHTGPWSGISAGYLR